MSMFVNTENLAATKPPVAPAEAPRAPELAVPRGYESAKVVLDFLCALLLLILTAPLIMLAMILIKLNSRGPAIYSQTRIGKNGQPFTIYKLRSMTHECESLTGAEWSKPGDARVTTVGRWLRKTHIDELPQLWNVLRGDMSLIGPRPERPEFVPSLEAAIHLYGERLQIRPGVTGFAQVQLPPDVDMESVRIKLAYDLHYVQHMSLVFDVLIYLATIGKIVGLSAQAIRTLCRFPLREAVDGAYQKLAQPTAKSKV